MNTATQINKLLLQLETQALRMTDARHPDIEIRLNVNCAVPGTHDITECALAAARTEGAHLDLTVAPVRTHCTECGTIFALTPSTADMCCPGCAK